MIEQQPSEPTEEFLRLIDRTDPNLREELEEAAMDADVDHKQMGIAANWLLNYGDRSSTDADEQLYWEEERIQIAGELEIYGNKEQIEQIIERYDDRASIIK